MPARRAGGEQPDAVPGCQFAEVRVQDEAGAVPLPPRLPRGDDEDAHRPKPTLAVVVATRNRPALLAGLLTALRAAVPDDTEIVVVDSASTTAETVDLCRRERVRVERLEQPGTSLARNHGVGCTTAEVIAFTDDDCLPAVGWGAALLRPFADPSVGLVTGRVVADREVSAPVSVLDVAAPSDLLRGRVLGHGANAAVRRGAFGAVGGFDVRLGPGAPGRASEDKDLFERLLAGGWHGRYEPAALVQHVQWRRPATALGLSFWYGFGQVRAGGRLRDAAWREGVRAALRDLRAGYLTGAVAGLLRAAGALAGRPGRP